MQWKTQAGNIATNFKFEKDFTLPALSAMSVVTWKFHVDDSAKGRHDMILVRDILTEFGLNLKFSEHVIEANDGHLVGSTAPMVDLGAYVRKYLKKGETKPKESFPDAYVEEVNE